MGEYVRVQFYVNARDEARFLEAMKALYPHDEPYVESSDENQAVFIEYDSINYGWDTHSINHNAEEVTLRLPGIPYYGSHDPVDQVGFAFVSDGVEAEMCQAIEGEPALIHIQGITGRLTPLNDVRFTQYQELIAKVAPLVHGPTTTEPS